MARFRYRSTLSAPRHEVFDWHARPGALDRLTPPWQGVEVLERPRGLEVGARAILRVPVGPFRRLWVAEHVDLAPGRAFRDVQRAGPFASWIHTHRMESSGERGSVLEDQIEYELPLGRVGRWLGAQTVRRQLQQVFAYRHATTAQDVRLLARTRGTKPLDILLAGASGLLGSALVPFLTAGGHKVTRLVRGDVEDPTTEIHWDPASGVIDAEALEGFDAVVHLGGANIADGRWSESRKAEISSSRIDGTSLLARTLAGLESKPSVFIVASAIGIYGDRGDEVLHEDSQAGSGFLPDVCRAWEAAAAPAQNAGIRVVQLRLGAVLSAAGGALKKMLTPFKLGVGGKIGTGRQHMSWIAIDDVLGIVHHALYSDDLAGPVNAVAPRSVSNLEFTKTLGRVLRRWTIAPLPAFAARIAFGEMADAVLLASADVRPQRLQDHGYEFLQPDLEGTLRRQLGRIEEPSE